MLGACREPDPALNPGCRLGLAIGTLAKGGRDKLTFLADPDIGLRRVGRAAHRREHRQARHGHRAGRPRAARRRSRRYGQDRVFVRLALAGGDGPTADATTSPTALAAAGHPVIRIELADPIDLAAEFVRWEVATAIAGAVLGIDPFDQPNVEEAKELTRDVLAGHERQAATTPAGADRSRPGGLDPPRRRALRLTGGDGDRRRRAARATSPGAGPTPTSRSRRSSRRRRPATRRSRGSGRCSATRPAARRPPGYGPRFLHSTGQLHKGGPPTAGSSSSPSDHPVDRPIPGWPYTFGRLIDAQAAGRLRGDRVPRPADRARPSRRPGAGLAALEPPSRGARPGLARSRAPDADDQSAREVDGMQDRVRRARPDGREHGPAAAARRPRGRRLQPDAGEDEGDRRRGRDRRVLDRGARLEAREAAGGLDHGPGRRRDRGPDRRAHGAPRARRHDRRRRQHELPRRPAPPRRARREGHPLRRRRASAGSGASRSATA